MELRVNEPSPNRSRAGSPYPLPKVEEGRRPKILPQARSADVGEVDRGAATSQRGIDVVDTFDRKTRVKVPLSQLR